MLTQPLLRGEFPFSQSNPESALIIPHRLNSKAIFVSVARWLLIQRAVGAGGVSEAGMLAVFSG